MEDYVGVIHLDSNAIDSRTNNKPAQFVNYTPSLFAYSNKNFEVALTEIQYQHCWYNLPQEQYIGFFEIRSKIPHYMRAIPRGHYTSIDELLVLINKAIYDSCRHVQPKDDKEKHENDLLRSIVYYEKTQKIKLRNLDLVQYEISFSLELAQVLGFTNQFFMRYTKADYEMIEKQEIIRITSLYPSVRHTMSSSIPFHNNERRIKDLPGDEMYMCMRFESKFPRLSEGERPFDITGGVDKLFIYCNLIKPHMFGNHSKQILRVIPVDRKDLESFGQNVTKSIVNPQFFPLFETLFDRIEIEIRDRAGQLIPFTGGSVIVTLEIRPKKDGGFLF